MGTDYMNCNLTLSLPCLRVLIPPFTRRRWECERPAQAWHPCWSGVGTLCSDKINYRAASDQSDLIMNWWHAVAFPKFNCELRLCKRCFPCLSFSRPCLGAKVSKAARCSFSPKRPRNFQPPPHPDGSCSPRERRLPGGPLGTPSPLCIPRFLLVATQVPLNLSTSPELPPPGPLLAAARAKAEGSLPDPRE